MHWARRNLEIPDIGTLQAQGHSSFWGFATVAPCPLRRLENFHACSLVRPSTPGPGTSVFCWDDLSLYIWSTRVLFASSSFTRWSPTVFMH